MRYLGKTTGELSEKEFSELSILFNHVFKRNVDVSFFRQKYQSPLFGFSYHGLMYNEDDKYSRCTHIYTFPLPILQYTGNRWQCGRFNDS